MNKKKIKFDAIILAGGRGSRLGKLTANKQKCTLLVNKVPFINHIINKMNSLIDGKISIATGFRNKDIIDALDNLKLDNIYISEEDRPLGTGGATVKAAKKTTAEFVVILNGDTFLDFDLSLYLTKKVQKGILLLGSPAIFTSKGSVFESNMLVYRELKKNVEVEKGMVFTGCCILNRSFLAKKAITHFSLDDLLKELIFSQCLDIKTNVGNFWDIGTIEGLNKTKKRLELEQYE